MLRAKSQQTTVFNEKRGTILLSLSDLNCPLPVLVVQKIYIMVSSWLITELFPAHHLCGIIFTCCRSPFLRDPCIQQVYRSPTEVSHKEEIRFQRKETRKQIPAKQIHISYAHCSFSGGCSEERYSKYNKTEPI